MRHDAWTVWWSRAIDLEASAASAIVVSQAASCRQACYYSRVKNHLTQPDPTLSRTKVYPEGIRIHRIGPRRLG
jgi:hypothetical protein